MGGGVGGGVGLIGRTCSVSSSLTRNIALGSASCTSPSSSSISFLGLFPFCISSSEHLRDALGSTAPNRAAPLVRAPPPIEGQGATGWFTMKQLHGAHIASSMATRGKTILGFLRFARYLEKLPRFQAT